MSSADHAEEGVGYLSMFEYNRFVWAWDKAWQIASWLYRAGQLNSASETNQRVAISTSASVNLASTWIAADEISSFLSELNGYYTPEEVVNHHEGAYWARELGRAVSTADRKWPQEDKPHRVKSMRCGGCQQLTLTYRPPRFERDSIMVDCSCGYRMTEQQWGWRVAILEAEAKEAK